MICMIEIFPGKHIYSTKAILEVSAKVNWSINDMNVTVNNVTIIYVDDLRLNRDYTVSCMTGFNKS